MSFTTNPVFRKSLFSFWGLLLITCFVLMSACQNETKPNDPEAPATKPTPQKPKSIAPLPSQAPETQEYEGPTSYKIMFRTGCDENAGTEAKLYLTMFGTRGQSKEMLMNQVQKNNFVSCSGDEFEIPAEENYGDLEKLVIRHDNTGENPNWMVEIVRVTDMKSGVRYDFPCGKWFDKDIGDQKISREFPIARECQ